MNIIQAGSNVGDGGAGEKPKRTVIIDSKSEMVQVSSQNFAPGDGSVITLLTNEGASHQDITSNLVPQLAVLRHTDEIMFLKPEKNVFDASILYDMRSGDDQRLFYIVRKTPTKFHTRCDIHIVDRITGDTYLRLLSSKLSPYKLIVKMDSKPLGVVTQTNWALCLPRFVIRDSYRNEVAVIRTKFELNNCCINLPQCCCRLNSGMFEVYRCKDPSTGKRLSKEIKLGTIGRIDHDEDDEDIVGGLLGINFEYDGLEVSERCLLIAATLFLDFNLFGTIQHSKFPYLCVLAVTFILIVIALAVVGFVVI